jgi:hypothetical protein
MGAEEHHKADEGQRWAEKEISSETTVVSEVVKLKDGGPRLGTPGAATHTGARRGVPSSAGSCVPAIGYPLPGAPVRWQGGRKARVKETLAQPCRSAVDGVGCQEKFSVSVTPHLCSIPHTPA